MNKRELNKEVSRLFENNWIRNMKPAIRELEISLKKHIDQESANKISLLNKRASKTQTELKAIQERVWLNADDIAIFYSTLNFQRGVDKEDIKSIEEQFDGAVPAKKENGISPKDLDIKSKKETKKLEGVTSATEEKLRQKIQAHNLVICDSKLSDCCSYSSYYDYQLPKKSQGWYCYNCFQPCVVTCIGDEREYSSALYQSKCHKAEVFWTTSELTSSYNYQKQTWRCRACQKVCDVEDKEGKLIYPKEVEIKEKKPIEKDSEVIQLSSYDFSDTVLGVADKRPGNGK